MKLEKKNTLPPTDREEKKLKKAQEANAAYFNKMQAKAIAFVEKNGLPKGRGL